MTWDEFMKGILILYAFGLATKDDWELKIWYRALQDEMSLDNYEHACIHLCKNNLKFWETDNIPAQLIDTYKENKGQIDTKLIGQRNQDEETRRKRERQEAIDSYDSEEDRLKCVEEFKEMNHRTFKRMPL
jgi:hypothetical protein